MDTLTPWLHALDIPAELPAAPLQAYDWLTDGGGSSEAAYDFPEANATDRLTQALLRARAAFQASQETRVRQIVRDYTLLKKLITAPTDAERPPVRECAPGKAMRWEYRGLMP